MHGFEFLESILQDVRYGIWLMARAPAVTALTVITLALGIGANTAVFSLVNAVIFRRLPAEDPSQLVLLGWSANALPRFTSHANYGDTQRLPLRRMSKPHGEAFSHVFLEEVEKSKIFSGVAAFASTGRLTMQRKGVAAPVTSQAVNGEFFRTLGIHAAAGRLLEPGDDRPSAAPVAVLNYGYWQRVFGASPSVIGEVVSLNGLPFTVVGVAEPKFVSLSLGNVYDLWLPMAMARQLDKGFDARHDDPGAWWLLILARLKSGVPLAQQQSAADTLFRRHVPKGSGPLAKRGDAPGITLLPAQDALIGASSEFANPLRVLMVAAGIVLLVACANLAGLLLSRAMSRTREVAVKLALGAGPGRLLRQLLTEGLILSALGAALGLVAAFWSARALVAMVASNRTGPLGLSASIDGRVLAFTGAISLLATILFGLAPAVRALQVNLALALKQGSSGSTGTASVRGRWSDMSAILVVLQTALATVSLVGAGLFAHTLMNLRSVDPGFDTRNTLTFGLSPQRTGYTSPQVDDLYLRLLEEIGALPGVTAASYSGAALLSGSWTRTTVKNLPPGGDKTVRVELDEMPVGPGFFETVRVRLLAGRALDQADIELARADQVPGSPNRPMPVVVNQMFAHRFFPVGTVLGQTFGENDGSDPDLPLRDPGYVIVGIAHDAKYSTLRQEIRPTIYTPLTGRDAVFEVRTAGEPIAIAPIIRDVVKRHDSALPLLNVLTESERIDRLLGQERLVASLSCLFGVLAVLLACIGLYGLLSYDVARRTREFGVRIALGARRADILRAVVWHGTALVAAGTALGLAVALATGRFLRTLLYEVRPGDPKTLAAVTLLMAIVVLAASSVPARRATGVDPIRALRGD
jgi:predicted permease